jgi:hypothetical protein
MELTRKQIESAKKSSFKRLRNFINEKVELKPFDRVTEFGVDWDTCECFFIVYNEKTDSEKSIKLTYKHLVKYNIFTPILRRYYETQ